MLADDDADLHACYMLVCRLLAVAAGQAGTLLEAAASASRQPDSMSMRTGIR